MVYVVKVQQLINQSQEQFHLQPYKFLDTTKYFLKVLLQLII